MTLSTENKALVERLITDYGARSIARLYPGILNPLLDAAREEGRQEGERRRRELEVEITGLRRSYFDERRSRLKNSPPITKG